MCTTIWSQGSQLPTRLVRCNLMLCNCWLCMFHRSCLPSGDQDRYSRHCSEPVTRGEKWVATQFFADADAS